MKEAPKALPPMDFSTFVMSLGSSAMVNMGEVPAPGDESPRIDLPAAKQIIDILGVLVDKTKGNLDEAEERLLTSLVYELRIKFVDAQQANAAPEMRIAIAVAACALVVSGCRRKADEPEPQPEPGPANAAVPTKPVRIVYPAAPGSFVDLAEDVADSVVNIRTTRPVAGGPASLIPGASDKHALGSGFIISNDGHVLTCDHFIAQVGDVEVRMRDGKTYPAVVVGRDARLDVALLKIDAPPPLAVVRQGSSDDLQVGEWVIAVGNPFGPETVMTAGVVGGLGLTDFSGAAAATPTLESFITTDARINALHAGGPVLNTAGEVVGIATLSDAKGGAFGFAVPIDRAKLILPMLKENGTVRRAWVGIYVREVDDARRETMELPLRVGALVTDVVGEGPGHRAGIERGDVIVDFDGKAVNHRNLPGLVATAGLGRAIEVAIVRDGVRKVLTLETTAMPE